MKERFKRGIQEVAEGMGRAVDFIVHPSKVFHESKKTKYERERDKRFEEYKAKRTKKREEKGG